MDVTALLVGLGVGAGLGALGVLALRRGDGARVATAEEAARQLQARVTELTDQVDAARNAEKAAREQLVALEPELAAAKERFQAQQKFLEDAQKQLAETFATKGQQALDANAERYLTLVDEKFKPMATLLDQQRKAVQELEDKRTKAYTSLKTTIDHLMEGHQRLDETAGQLASAMRRPDQRGKWGEVQLRNVVELAGMVEHCDFTEQDSTTTDDSRRRPDMLVRLPGNGTLVVDAKAPLNAYLDALDAAPGSPERAALLKQHADALKTQVRSLSSKAYWKQFQRAPEVVVMFVPLESALTAAMEADPELHVKALENKVLLASPTLLLGLLRAVSFGWRQEAVAQNAQQIADLGQTLHARIGKFLEHWDNVGQRLTQATSAYNDSVGSMRERLLKSAQSLQALGAAADETLTEGREIPHEVRRLPADILEPKSD